MFSDLIATFRRKIGILSNLIVTTIYR